MKKNWYALYTKPNCEKKVATLLARKKIENFYPLNRIVSNNQVNKKKVIHEPLIPSYVFVYITDDEIIEVRKTNCVINFVYWLEKPAIITRDEMLNMEQFTKAYSNITLEKTPVNPNEVGKIVSEPQIGINGKLISVKNEIVYLGLPSLGYLMVAKFEKTNVDIFNYDYEKSNLFS